MTSPSSYTDAQVEEWASVQKMVYELVRGVATVVDMAGSDRADATAFAEFRKALQHFLVPQIYNRASVEGVVQNIGKEQRPMLEFLISLMEQDQDEDLAGLAQASRGASMNVVDLMALDRHRDREISKAFRSAMQSLDAAVQTGPNVRLSTMMKGLLQ